MKNKEGIDFTTKAGKRTLSSIVREIFFLFEYYCNFTIREKQTFEKRGEIDKNSSNFSLFKKYYLLIIIVLNLIK